TSTMRINPRLGVPYSYGTLISLGPSRAKLSMCARLHFAHTDMRACQRHPRDLASPLTILSVCGPSPGTLHPRACCKNINGQNRMNALETSTLGKVTKRLVPFLIICYFVAYLDRVNVGFAALTMNKDLGLSQTAFGFGAGIFFIAYFIFEVPSNLLLERFGARKSIALIMVSWAIL